MVCIAVDIGASNGRLIAGWIENNKLITKEIHRFPNSMIRKNGHLYWNIEQLYDEILLGISKCNMPFVSIGIDAWGVDYALLNEDGTLMADVFAYRDHRTNGIVNSVNERFIYERTGIQIAPFNTLYQLMAHKDRKASCFLTVPDYLHYRLCGVKVCEYSNATTTQLLNINTGKWDNELISLTGFDSGIFPEVVKSGTVIGNMKKNKNIKVIVPASHDTASAIAAIPTDSTDFAYISSGTWSLMGIESKIPYLNNKNFTNEGGVFETYRVLKNIMGLWMIQEVQRLLPKRYSFADLAKMAETPFGSIINVEDNRFLNPKNMIEEIQIVCKATGQLIPKTAGELSRCIFDSLAFSYKETLEEIRQFSDVKKIHIIGGGSQNKLLNKLTAQATGCKVIAGPTEATAIGNIIIQLISLGEISNLAEARKLVTKSFDIEEYY